MNSIHSDLTKGRWFKLSLIEQLANVGSEAGRAMSWRRRGEVEHFDRAFDRTLELLDLTIADQRWRKRGALRELLRLREVLCAVFFSADEYKISFEDLEKYFLYFGIASRRNR